MHYLFIYSAFIQALNCGWSGCGEPVHSRWLWHQEVVIIYMTGWWSPVQAYFHFILICLSHQQFLCLFKDLTLNRSIPVCKYLIFDRINFYMLRQNPSNAACFCEGRFTLVLQKLKVMYFCKYAVDMVFMASHGPRLFSVYTVAWKSRCFKSTNIFRHTLPAVWAAHSARIPRLVCSMKYTIVYLYCIICLIILSFQISI